MTSRRSSLDRTAFRAVDWDEHVAAHDDRWLDYWLSQPISARLAGAQQCRRRVHGRSPLLDRSSFRVIDFVELTD